MSVPSGTVTFLFTDIEGSTRLWESSPSAMRAALIRHDALLRAAIAAHGGYVFATGGDGFAAAFARGADAMAAAVEARQALGSEPWPDGATLKVRMGLHSGEVEERGGDYFGPAVNRAARLMAVAHGGQTVCSATTAGLVAGVVLVDLGEHRLRDLAQAQRVFQLGEGTFPPLRSVAAFRSNLPSELSSFIGRALELQAVAKQLGAGRVVSIVGVGGVGKTRLALHAAADLLQSYADGAWICELASVTEPASIPDAVAAALEYAPPQGVPVADGLARFLERKNLLLVLDNCEHLIDAAAAFVTTTAGAAPGVSVLATSREALGVPGEQIYPLGSLGLPTAGDAASVLGSEAGALFLGRAAEAGRTLDVEGTAAQTLQDLCVQLDGIPLAIELAAARTAMMTPAEIVARLDRQFRLLTGGGRTRLEHHQTLRAAIDWSYDLLGDDERMLLNRLSVCVGGFDLAAVTALAAGVGIDEFESLEVLGSLVAKSLVERSESGGVTRYRLLEMIRQYTAEQLGNATEVARDDHAHHYLAVAADLFTQMVSSASYDDYDRLVVESSNIAFAARWLLTNDRLQQLLGWFARLPFVDYFVLPTRFIDDLGAIAAEAVHRPKAGAIDGFPAACDQAATGAIFAGKLGDFEALVTLAEQHPSGRLHTRVIAWRASVCLDAGDTDTALVLCRRAVEQARGEGQPSLLAWVLAHGVATGWSGAHQSPSALETAAEAVEIARRTGGVLGLLYPLTILTLAARELDPQLALAAAEECVRLDRTQSRMWAAASRMLASHVRVTQGQVAAGLRAWLDAVGQLTHNGARHAVASAIGHLADILAPMAPQHAIDLAAIGESEAIAPFASFTGFRQLTELAETHPAAVADARARAAAMSYDEATTAVTEIVERLIADHTDTAGS